MKRNEIDTIVYEKEKVRDPVTYWPTAFWISAIWFSLAWMVMSVAKCVAVVKG